VTRRGPFRSGGKLWAVILLPCIGLGLVWFLYIEVIRARHDAQCDALWSSAESGDNASVRQFLADGVDPNCQGGKPLKYAIRGGHQDTVRLLRKAGAK